MAVLECVFFPSTIITLPLSVCITTIFASVRHLVFHVFFYNKMTVLDSLLINFAKLTIYAQSFMCLSEFLSRYVCFVVRDQVVSNVSFIIHEIHHSRKKISNLFSESSCFLGFITFIKSISY